MSILREIYRNSFPKGLRYDKECQILFAELYTLVKRNKHRKYIPKVDLRSILDGYEALPGPPLLKYPGIRHVLLLRQVNSIRTFYGKRAWLISLPVACEHAKVVAWLDRQGGGPGKGGGAAATSSTTYRRADAFVEREKFVTEVLNNFHVATMYHRGFRLALVLAALITVLIFASINIDYVVFLYLRHYCRMSRSQIIDWFAAIAEHHTLTEVPPAYRSLLPPPCVRYSPVGTAAPGAMAGSSGGTDSSHDAVLVTVTEFVSADGAVSVVAVPCPVIGEKRFFERLGTIARSCDAVMMEGITMDRVDKIFPAVLLPLKHETFPVIGVSHRFIDVIRSRNEPPLLYPAGSKLGWRAEWSQFLLPFEMRCVYYPTTLFASKGEARNGWGRLRELIEMHTASIGNAAAAPGEAAVGAAAQKAVAAGERYTICLPWSVSQIVNLEASLLKHDFRIGRVFHMKWMDLSHMGSHFCDYFGIAE